MAEQIDNLSYTYTGNRLNTVTDASANYQGYPDTSGTPMTYDANGNMTQHEDKGILNISYNFLNLPTHIIFNESAIRGDGGKGGGMSYFVNKTTDYTYRADGTKLQKKHLFFTGQLQGYDTVETTDYLDGFQYSHTTGGDPGSIFPDGLQFVPTAEGYYNFENNTYIYQYKDHLGNVRITYYSGNGGAEIIKDNQYYPFGLSHYVNESGYAGNRSYQYQYNSKEYQSDSGMYDYGARFYMPDIGRWGVVDPLAEKYPYLSPYAYAGNNPALFVDFDGKDFGIRIDHTNKTIIIDANYYYQNQSAYDSNLKAMNSWNSLNGSYTTKDGVSYAVSFNLKGSVVEEGQKVQNVANADPIGNSVQELSDGGYENLAKEWFKGDTEKFNDHIQNQGAGLTRGDENIANKSSSANDQTRAHEMGHTLGQGENAGGAMDYSSKSYNSMSLPNGTNLKNVLKDGLKRASDKSSLNSPGRKPINSSTTPNVVITVSGQYDGKKGFEKVKDIESK